MIVDPSRSPSADPTDPGPVMVWTDAIMNQEYDRGYREGHTAGVRIGENSRPPAYWPAPSTSDADKTFGRIVVGFMVGLILGVLSGLFIGLFVCMRAGWGGG